MKRVRIIRRLSNRDGILEICRNLEALLIIATISYISPITFDKENFAHLVVIYEEREKVKA